MNVYHISFVNRDDYDYFMVWLQCNGTEGKKLYDVKEESDPYFKQVEVNCTPENKELIVSELKELGITNYELFLKEELSSKNVYYISFEDPDDYDYFVAYLVEPYTIEDDDHYSELCIQCTDREIEEVKHTLEEHDIKGYEVYLKTKGA